MKFRKRPVVIEAEKFTEGMYLGHVAIPDGVVYGGTVDNGERLHFIRTLEGNMAVKAGDMIITGVKGEKYPCKLDIFERTYEAVRSTDL